jgi:hypothetical protein
VLVHLQRLLQERCHQQRMVQNVILAPSAERGYLNIVRALRTTQQERITGLLLNEPGIATSRNRALAMALRQNMMPNM